MHVLRIYRPSGVFSVLKTAFKSYNQMAKPQVTEIGTPTGTPLSDVSPTTLMPAPRLLTAGPGMAADQ